MNTKEAQAFVKVNNAALESGFAFDVPWYSFRWDGDAGIIMMDIQCRNGSHKRTYALGYEDVSLKGLWNRIHNKLDVYTDLYPEWNQKDYIDTWEWLRACDRENSEI